MAEGFINKCKDVLQSLIKETTVFISGVELAEAHPEAAISLSRTCMKLVSETIGHLKSQDKRDEYLEEAYDELKIARDLFMSVIVGEPVSVIARRFVPQGAEDRRVLILDIAHSHTHRAIDLLKKSKNFRLYHEPLNLLSRARRESAPTTLYRLAYEMARTR